MLSAILRNLERGKKLLISITDEQYSQSTTPPYFSSIGSHTRHILDIYQCIFNGLESGLIDFTYRERNFLQEQSTNAGLDYLNQITSQICSLTGADLNKEILVTDDLGEGKLKANSTLAAVLIQAHSHTIHHYAIIGFLVYNLGIELPDADFGYNPTTPKKELLD